MRPHYLLLALFIPLFSSGCVGLAATIPRTELKVEIANHERPFEQSDYLPRLAKERENVVKDSASREIRYDVDHGSTCYQHFVLFPWFSENCRGRSEVWSYKQNGRVTITTKEYRIYGAWCSPIPFLAVLSSAPLGIAEKGKPSVARVFCEYHFGSALHGTNHF